MIQHVLKVSDFEQRLLIASLNDFRNTLLTAQKPTEDINHLLVKVIDAPTKKGRDHYESR